MLRPLRAADLPAVRRLFRATIALGRPLPFADPALPAYEALCLDWYLAAGRDDAAVLVVGGEVAGYALVCTDERAYRRWAVPAALAWGTATVVRLATGRLAPQPARFARLRLRDGLDRRLTAPAPAHAHVNLAPGVRRGLAGLRLAHHVDARCTGAGLTAWYGEVNARAGRRAVGLQQRGGRIVATAPNRTLSWLAAEPIERLTVVRTP